MAKSVMPTRSKLDELLKSPVFDEQARTILTTNGITLDEGAALWTVESELLDLGLNKTHVKAFFKLFPPAATSDPTVVQPSGEGLSARFECLLQNSQAKHAEFTKAELLRAEEFTPFSWQTFSVEQWLQATVKDDIFAYINAHKDGQWPSAYDIIYANKQPSFQFAMLLRNLILQFQEIAKEADAVPLWYRYLKEKPQRFEDRGYRSLVSLGLSFIFDVNLWRKYESKIKETCGSQLVSPPTSANEQQDFIERIWQGDDKQQLLNEWLNAPESKYHTSDVLHHSHMWHSLPWTAQGVTELTLTGLVLGRIFDAFYAYVPAHTVLRGSVLGNLSEISATWRRNVKEPNAEVQPDFVWDISFKYEDKHGSRPRKPTEHTIRFLHGEDTVLPTRDTPHENNEPYYSDHEVVLRETHATLLQVAQEFNLSRTDMSKLILPAIHTQWPMIYVYGVTLLPDSCALAVSLCKANAFDLTQGRLLCELNMRVLLLLRHTLSLISDRAFAGDSGDAAYVITCMNTATADKSDTNSSSFVETLHRVWKQHTRNGMEEEILQRLAPHSSHFPRLLYATLTPDYFAIEYIPDRPIASWTEARRLASSLVEAVMYLHSSGFVHRDLKRSNVRFTGNDAILIDFDSAAAWQAGDPPLCGVAGSALWRSPEAEAGEDQTDKVDIWGIGMVLMDEVLHFASHGVYSVPTWPAAREPVIVARFLGNSVSDSAMRLLARLLLKEPAERPTTRQILASEFLDPAFGWKPVQAECLLHL